MKRRWIGSSVLLLSACQLLLDMSGEGTSAATDGGRDDSFDRPDAAGPPDVADVTDAGNVLFAWGRGCDEWQAEPNTEIRAELDEGCRAIPKRPAKYWGVTRLFFPAELPADGGSFGVRVNARACDAGSQEELVLGVVLIGQAFRRTSILPSESYESLTLDELVCPPDGVIVNVNMTSDAGCFVVRDAVITQ